ncbi:MAG: diacylglycerol kinase family lipid kinase [Spirochaetes bacterium]|nr:diacylglycerol kinase family lipid kinase [Spirochaetota bacterium]
MKKYQKKKYLMIVNPKSGSVKHQTIINIIKRYFQKYKMHLEILFTQYPGHATEITREVVKKDRIDVIIGAGGDGTINEVLNGMVGSNKILGVLPWGTGNVFAKEMNIPLNPKKACALIRKGQPVRMDIARRDQQYFFLMFSCGFDAYSIKYTENLNLKRFFKRFTYVFGGLRAFATYDFPKIQIEIDDQIMEKGTFVVVSNTSYYGTYFTITPFANPLDGYLDIYVYKAAGKWNLLKLIFLIIYKAMFFSKKRKKRIFLNQQAYYRGKKIRLTALGSSPYTQVDGELSLPLPAEIIVVPQAIKVVLPHKKVKKFMKKKYDTSDPDKIHP